MRRPLSIVLSLALFGFLFVSCGEDGLFGDLFDKDHPVAIEDLPAGVTAYIGEHYPESTIKEAEREKQKGHSVLEVELNTGEELTFDMDGHFLRMEVEEDDD